MDATTLGMLKDTSDVSNLSDAAKQGVQMASAYQDIQNKQVQAQAQAQQIDEAKNSNALGAISTYTKMSPKLRNSFRGQTEKVLDSSGLTAHGPILDAIDGDDTLSAGIQGVLQDKEFLKANNLDINAINARINANPMDTQSALHELISKQDDFHKLKAQGQNNIDTAKVKAQADTDKLLQVQEAKNKGATDTATIRATGQGARVQQQANNSYVKEMGKPEQAIYQANRANDLLEHISADDLKATPAIANDLNGAVASLINGGKPATVYGMSHQELDSAWARLQKAGGFLTGKAVGTVTDDQLDQMKKDITAISGNVVKQHENQFASYIEGQPEGTKQALVNRYNTFRTRQGLSPYAASDSTVSAPAPTKTQETAPQAAPAQSSVPPISNNAPDTMFIQNAVKIINPATGKNYTQQEAQAKLQAKKGGQ